MHVFIFKTTLKSSICPFLLMSINCHLELERNFANFRDIDVKNKLDLVVGKKSDCLSLDLFIVKIEVYQVPYRNAEIKKKHGLTFKSYERAKFGIEYNSFKEFKNRVLQDSILNVIFLDNDKL